MNKSFVFFHRKILIRYVKITKRLKEKLLIDKQKYRENSKLIL